jgi:SAM-dependent methyltransferase
MLDFGCGMKPYRDLFSVDQYIGLDIKNEGHNNDQSQVDCFYDGRTIPFADEYFDSFYSSEVLTHISTIEPVMVEVSRVLKTGAKVFITVPFVWHENEQPNDAIRFTSFGIISLLERHGMKIIRQHKCGNYFTAAIQTRNAFLYHVLFPKSLILKLILTIIFVFPYNLIGVLLSPILGRNQDLFSNMIVLAERV